MNDSRKGATILEATAALAFLAAGLVFTAQVLTACATHRHASQQLVAGQIEAANIAERVSLLPYENLTDTKLSELTVSPQLLAVLPHAKLKLTSEGSAPNEPSCKHIKIQIEWPAPDGAPISVNLSTWRYADAAGGQR